MKNEENSFASTLRLLPYLIITILLLALLMGGFYTSGLRYYNEITGKERDSLDMKLKKITIEENLIISELSRKQLKIDSLNKVNWIHQYTIMLIKRDHGKIRDSIKDMTGGEIYDAFIERTVNNEIVDSTLIIPVANIKTAVILFDSLDEVVETITAYEGYIIDMDSVNACYAQMNKLYSNQVTLLHVKCDTYDSVITLQDEQIKTTNKAFKKFKVCTFVGGAILVVGTLFF